MLGFQKLQSVRFEVGRDVNFGSYPCVSIDYFSIRILALTEPSSSTHFTEHPDRVMNPAASWLVVLSVGFRSPRELSRPKF